MILVALLLAAYCYVAAGVLNSPRIAKSARRVRYALAWPYYLLQRQRRKLVDEVIDG